MNKKRSALIASALVTLGLAGYASLATASAQASGADNLIDKLVAKFNLNKDEVSAVFDEVKTEQEAERTAEFSERLQEAVDDGDITAEQKTLIENKMTEVKAAMKAERDELEAWAEQNGVDAKYLMMGGPRDDDDDRLQDTADDGDITAEQKTAIEAKQDELKDKRDARRPDQRSVSGHADARPRRRPRSSSAWSSAPGAPRWTCAAARVRSTSTSTPGFHHVVNAGHQEGRTVNRFEGRLKATLGISRTRSAAMRPPPAPLTRDRLLHLIEPDEGRAGSWSSATSCSTATWSATPSG